MGFPENFKWGAATAAYQVEGAAFEDGRGLSVWDVFCREPGKTFEGHTGERASGHYARFKEDVAIMKAIGLRAYRFSLSWPRIFPEGGGPQNQKGLDFYNRLVDELLDAGVQPYLTLFHWDYPYALYRRGGWLNPDSPRWFAEYAAAAANALGDRVSHWITLNEPQVFIALGHQFGTHAPGLKLSRAQTLQAAHNALLAHGQAAQALRANANKPRLGIAPATDNFTPDSESAQDIDAARARTFGVGEHVGVTNAFWTDPVCLGKYPEAVWDAWKEDMPHIRTGDMQTIRQPLDFLGLNIYTARAVKAAPEYPLGQILPRPTGYPITTYRWPITPHAMYWTPRFMHERYNLPLCVTENGVANMDWPHLDGKVHDPQRIDFLTRYLRCLARAIEEGVPVEGYFTWSFIDNFEWNEGFSQRFGLVYVDYKTHQRTLKDSARWYGKLIKTNGAILGAPARRNTE